MRDKLRHAKTYIKRNLRMLFGVIGIVAVPAIAYGIWALLNWQIEPSNAGERKDALTLFAQIVGGIVLSIGVFLTYKRVAAAEKAVEVAQEGQITERFTRAIEQLGSDKLAVRLGGIYALERIARDSERDHWPIMEVLTAFVRENALWKEDNQEDSTTTQDDDAQKVNQFLRPRADIQAILTVIGRRVRWYGNGEDQRLDLSETDLRGADLRGVRLDGAGLFRVHLEEADLHEAHLEGAILSQAHLENADLFGAHLEDASLFRAHLERASLNEAHLEGASLGISNVVDTSLWVAHLERASLNEAHLEGTILVGVDLTETHNLTQKQIESAIGDKDTKLPPHLTMPDSWKEQ